MKRNLEALQNKEYDILVIGGGIYGAFVAWDAALRGLSVALVERKDFGHATSANSLKTVHGGLRYLKDLNPKRARIMIREQRTWMRIAPHLVRPLPVLMPTEGMFLRSRWLLRAALQTNQLMGIGLSGDSRRQLPPGRILGRDEGLARMNGHFLEWANGAALWHDCQIADTERLLVSVVLSASRAGADVANYLEVAEIQRRAAEVCGVQVEDRLRAGNRFRIGAKVTVNCAGPWVNALSRKAGCCSLPRQLNWSLAINLVTPPIFEGTALALPQRSPGSGGRHPAPLLFIVPWKSHSIVGTLHHSITGDPRNDQNSGTEVEELIQRANHAIPGLALRRSDVSLVHKGYLPSLPNPGHPDQVKLVREGWVQDHEARDGIRGFISVVGVKYTAARVVAEKAVDMAIRKLGVASSQCLTATTALWGHGDQDLEVTLRQAIEKRPRRIPPETIQRLAVRYGSDYPQILNLIQRQPALGKTLGDDGQTTRAEVLHAVREEMALTLEDVVRRRTELGSAGLPGEGTLRSCAGVIAGELGWNEREVERQIRTVQAGYPEAEWMISITK